MSLILNNLLKRKLKKLQITEINLICSLIYKKIIIKKIKKKQYKYLKILKKHIYLENISLYKIKS